MCTGAMVIRTIFQGLKLFAAYTDEGNQERFGKYPNRLHIEFEFTNKTGDIIYLDDDMKDQFPTGKHPFPDDDEDEKKPGFYRLTMVNSAPPTVLNDPYVANLF